MTEPEPTGSVDSLSNEEIDSQIQQLEAVVGRGTDPASEEKPKGVTEALMREEMEKIYDKSNSESDQKIAAEAPVLPAAKDITQAFQNYGEWMDKPEAEKETLRDAHGEVERIKANAKAFKVELTDAEALKYAWEEERKGAGAIPAEYAPAVEGIKQLHPNEAPHTIMQKYVDINRAVMDKPVETLGGLYSNATGQHPLEMAVQMARQYSPAEHKAFYETRDAGLVTKTFMACNPDLDRQEMAKAIMKVPSTGDDIKDLLAARDYVSKNRKQSGKSRARSMESEMRDIFESRNRR